MKKFKTYIDIEKEREAKRKELLDDVDVLIYGDLNHIHGAYTEYRFAISAIMGYLVDKKYIEPKEIYMAHFELEELLDPTKLLRKSGVDLGIKEIFLSRMA